MKTDPSTKILLGIIATGVAAMTALAFERRYHRQLRHLVNQLDGATGHACESLGNQTRQAALTARNEAATLRDRFEDGVENLREKASGLKDRVSDSVERVSGHLRDGAEKLREGFKTAASEAKEDVEDAAEEAKRTFKA